MRLQESIYLEKVISKIHYSSINPILNIGSSSKKFREQIKPHINEKFLQPLQNKGFTFVNLDLKQDEGIDIYGDIFSQSVQEQIYKANPKSILLTNVLEHISDIDSLSKICLEFIPVGGYLFVSVPYSYPYHADPIDTYYRPTPIEIAHLFPNTKILDSIVLEAGSFFSDIPSKYIVSFCLEYIIRLLLPLYKPKAWLNYFHKLFWLYRSYKISIVVLQKQ